MCAMTRMRLTLAPQPHPLGDRRPHVVAPYHRFDDWVAGWPNRPHIVRHLIAPHRWVRTVVIPDAKRPRRSGASLRTDLVAGEAEDPSTTGLLP